MRGPQDSRRLMSLKGTHDTRSRKMNHADLYKRITDRIITQLEKGVAPWQRPWATIGGGLPANVVSRKPYRGINTLLLWSAAEEHGYESNLWATYRQWDA